MGAGLVGEPEAAGCQEGRGRVVVTVRIAGVFTGCLGTCIKNLNNESVVSFLSFLLCLLFFPFSLFISPKYPEYSRRVGKETC